MDEAYWITAQRAASIVDKARISVQTAADSASDHRGTKARADQKRLSEIVTTLQGIYDELLDMEHAP